jgi:hypothetical protein
VLKGVVAVYGQLRWCPPGTVNDEGRCDPARTREIVTQRPVLIRIG